MVAVSESNAPGSGCQTLGASDATTKLLAGLQSWRVVAVRLSASDSSATAFPLSASALTVTGPANCPTELQISVALVLPPTGRLALNVTGTVPAGTSFTEKATLKLVPCGTATVP